MFLYSYKKKLHMNGSNESTAVFLYKQIMNKLFQKYIVMILRFEERFKNQFGIRLLCVYMYCSKSEGSSQSFDYCNG